MKTTGTLNQNQPTNILTISSTLRKVPCFHPVSPRLKFAPSWEQTYICTNFALEVVMETYLKRQSSCQTSCAYLTQNVTRSLTVSIFVVKNYPYISDNIRALKFKFILLQWYSFLDLQVLFKNILRDRIPCK